jgi:predicted dehydrogenase
MGKIGVGLVGVGYWGEKLLPKFLNSKDASVTLVCDKSSEHRAKIGKLFPTVSTSSSYQQLIDDSEVEALVIVTPPATHYSLARQAIQAGKHVWIEKPLALQLDQGRELVRLARLKGVVLFVDHTFLYDSAIRNIRQRIAKGELGRVYHIFLQRLNLGRIKRDSNVWWNSAPHDISIILYLLSARPTSISLHGYCYLQRNLEDLNVAVMEMDNGTSAFIYHNWIYPENTAKLTIVGAKRSLVYEGKFDRRSLKIYEYAVDNSPTARPSETLRTTIPSRMVAEHKIEGIYDQEPLALAVNDFLESIQFARTPRSDGEFSLKVLAALEAGERSLRSGGEKTLVENQY